MSKTEIEQELAQIDATISLLNERRYRLLKKMEEGVSTPSNARKGLSEKEAQDLISSRRKKAYAI